MRLAVIAAVATLAAATASAEIVETVKVKITGGPNAGTHEASTESGGCSYGYAGPGSWGNQLSSRDKDPKKLNSLQLIVPDAKKAASGTDKFMVLVGFGPLLHRSAEYKVDTTKGAKSGSGTVTVKDGGNTGHVTFNATTADGVKLEGEIDCKTVARAEK